MKKIKLALAAGMLTFIMAGCGQVEGAATVPEQEISRESTDTETLSTDTSNETLPGETANTEASTTEASSEAATEEVANTEASDTGAGAEDGETEYTDNFSVDNKAAADFGKKVKDAVAAEDIEALAELMAFPAYVGFPDEGLFVETKEDFIALGAERIFTAELLDSIAAADEESLSASMAGFTLSKETGAPNVNFGVVNGRLAVTGMNY